MVKKLNFCNFKRLSRMSGVFEQRLFNNSENARKVRVLCRHKVIGAFQLTSTHIKAMEYYRNSPQTNRGTFSFSFFCSFNAKGELFVAALVCKKSSRRQNIVDLVTLCIHTTTLMIILLWYYMSTLNDIYLNFSHYLFP